MRMEYFEDKKDIEEKNFLSFEKHKMEYIEKTQKVLEDMGIESGTLEKLNKRFLNEMPKHIESFFINHPESQGYLTKVEGADLPDGVLARTGPYINENGEYAGGRIQFSNRFFGKSNYELKIVGMESELNWRKERWIAGEGSEGIISHELGHILQLKINAEDAGLKIGEFDEAKYEGMQKRYFHNSKIVTICNDSLHSLNISPIDIGREVSTYASSDFGELFAEAVSQVETSRNPGRLSKEIYRRYQQFIDGRDGKEVEICS